MKELLSIIAQRQRLAGSEIIKQLLNNLSNTTAYQELRALVPELEEQEKKLQIREKKRRAEIEKELQIREWKEASSLANANSKI